MDTTPFLCYDYVISIISLHSHLGYRLLSFFSKFSSWSLMGFCLGCCKTRICEFHSIFYSKYGVLICLVVITTACPNRKDYPNFWSLDMFVFFRLRQVQITQIDLAPGRPAYTGVSIKWSNTRRAQPATS